MFVIVKQNIPVFIRLLRMVKSFKKLEKWEQLDKVPMGVFEVKPAA
jgi:hypothetical protein